MKKTLFFVSGFALVIIGIALVLREWAAVVVVFKGVIGAVLAIAGLVVLCIAKE